MKTPSARLKKYGEVLAATGSHIKAIQAALLVSPDEDRSEKIKAVKASGAYVDFKAKRPQSTNEIKFT